MSKKCPKCGEDRPEVANYCLICRTCLVNESKLDTDTLRREHKNHPNAREAKYCIYCGIPLVDEPALPPNGGEVSSKAELYQQHLTAGNKYLENKNLIKALEEYRFAKDIDGTSEIVQKTENIGQLLAEYNKHKCNGNDYFENGDFKKAVEEYEVAVEIDNTDSEIIQKLEKTKKLSEKQKEADNVIFQVNQKLNENLTDGSRRALKNALKKLNAIRNEKDIDAIDIAISECKTVIEKAEKKRYSIFIGFCLVATLIFFTFIIINGRQEYPVKAMEAENKANAAFDDGRNEEAFKFYTEAASYHYQGDRSDSIKKVAALKFQGKAKEIIKSIGECDQLSKMLLEHAKDLYPSEEIQNLLDKCDKNENNE
ncbi:MAG: hypothetical protein FWF52_09200 [Candidatus Azobacteroides sp.]|nr:hypothetical protein [Candidatus Azobacteroides sp.]